MTLIGATTGYRDSEAEMDAEFARFEKLELNACQLNVGGADRLTQEDANRVLACAKRHGVTITAVWGGCSGPHSWNFTEGPITIGLVPPEYREMRVKELLADAAFAYRLGITDVITHCGFLPENFTDPLFRPVADALYTISSELKKNGQWFLFETGQETPVTLLRYIEEVGTGNLGINLDTANLILYGKANPVDALDVIGKYVRNTHFKDGFYPTTGKELGRECALGQGKVDVRGVVNGLMALGYPGPWIIEREISGEQQTKDMAMARDLILGYINE